MGYLLDTHAIIWYFENSAELPDEIEKIIDNPEVSIYICSVSLWEIAIKVSIGKLELQIPLNELLNHINNGDFNVLHIGDTHLNRLIDLPFIHKDPFDRLIISSALVEGLTIITVDENIKKYNVPCIW